MIILFFLSAVKATSLQQEISSDPRIIGGSIAIRKGKLLSLKIANPQSSRIICSNCDAYIMFGTLAAMEIQGNAEVKIYHLVFMKWLFCITQN